MIYAGERNNRIITNVNEELSKLDGYLTDEVARASFCQFLRGNIGFAAQMIGGIELFPFQEAAIRAMFQKDSFLMIGGRGISKCLRENDLCLTTRGMVRIKDIKPGDYVRSDKGVNLVTNKWDNPEQDTIKLTTKRKYHLEGLPEHRFLVFNPETFELDYKFLADVKLGDIVPIKHSTMVFGDAVVKPKTTETFDFIQDEDFYYFLGLLLGDGCMPVNGGFTICTSDEEIKNFLIRFLAERFPQNSQKYYTRLNKVENYSFICYNTEFTQFLNSIGFITGVKADKKKIPDFVLSLPMNFQAAFLSGLLDTDGYCAIQEKPKKNSLTGVIGLTSSSEQIIDTFHTLLINYGIISNIAKVHSAGPMIIMGNSCTTKDAWSVAITGLSNLRNFRDRIGFRLSRKKDRLNYILENKTYEEDLFSNYLPIGFKLKKDYFGSKFRRAGHRFKHKNISVEKLRKMLDMGVFTDEDYRKIKLLVDGNYYFDTVTKLEESRAITCDITVENEHCYWGNGFINHNSWSAAAFAWLYALMTPGVKIGIISASFRQARVLFQYIEDMAKSKGGRLLEQCLVGDISHKNDYHSMEIGRSKIVALPLGSGSKLRGFRFNVMLIDELLLVPEKVINEVVLPFLGVNADPIKRKKIIDEEDYLVRKGLMQESERTTFANSKFIGLSSASYQFEYLYKIYAEYVEKIYAVDPRDERGEPVDTNSYGVMQLSYKVAPKHLYNDEFIAKAKAQMSEAQFNREYGSIFTADSGGFFSRKKMDSCTVEAGKYPTVEIQGEPMSKYILAIDPSWGKNESSDHFAMSLFKIDEAEKRITLVHSYAVPGAPFDAHLTYLTYLLNNFNIVYVIIDNAGSWFLDDANSSVLFKENGLSLLTFDADFDNQVYAEGLRKSKQSYSLEKKKLVHVQYFDLEWIRKANERLGAAFDHRNIRFASKPLDDQYRSLMQTKVPIDSLIYDMESNNLVGEQRKADFIEHQSYMIDLVKDETSLIETTTTDTGKITFRLPSSVKNDKSTTRARRDSYSSLLLGNWAAKCYFDMHDKIEERPRFIPYFID